MCVCVTAGSTVCVLVCNIGFIVKINYILLNLFASKLCTERTTYKLINNLCKLVVFEPKNRDRRTNALFDGPLGVWDVYVLFCLVYILNIIVFVRSVCVYVFRIFRMDCEWNLMHNLHVNN